MKNISKKLPLMILALTFASVSYAKDLHKVVIQISTDDKKVQALALNNAVNLQKHYGIDNVEVEVVAYGPGLSVLTAESEESNRVKNLSMQNIHFNACENTMEKVKKDTGKDVTLTSGVVKVTAGVVKIVELQEEGYTYLRP